MESNNQPTSSSSPICTQCQEAKQVLKYVLPLSSGKKEFCSEPCLTLYRKESKSKKPDEVNHPIDETKPTKHEIEHALSNSTPSTTSEVSDSADKSALTSSDHKSVTTGENAAHIPPPASLFEDDSEFSWAPYLRETKSSAAPNFCFKQSSHPLKNEFTIGSKLEAQDPRSQMACIATVISVQGPRLRLRLDGSDTKNDFWKMVDDSELHEIGHCEKMGGMLQPPMGFTLNATSWPKFLAKTLKDAVYCPSRCFKKEHTGPKINRFQIGMKLEAVDKKNPHLICAATVGAIDAENVHISFDGWKGAFDYWTRFDSRDIFPCGWCSAVNHPLQPPGQKACAGKAKINNNLSTLDNSYSSHCPSPRNTSNSRAASMSPRATSSPKQPVSPEKKSSRGDSDDSNRVSNSNISSVCSPSVNISPPVEVQIFVVPPAIDACGTFLDYKKISQLPASFGPGAIHQVFRKSVQSLVDSALDQKEIFGLLRQGEGKVIITASFEDKMQNVRLPVVETESTLWDFMEILFEELRCEMFYSKTKVEPRKREHSSDNEIAMPDKKKKVQVNINKLKLQKKHKKEEKQSPLLLQQPQDADSQSNGKQCTSPGGSTPPSAYSTNGSKRVPIYHNAHKLHQAQRAARQFGKGEPKQGNETGMKPFTTLSNGDKPSTNTNENTDSTPPLLTPVFSTTINPKPSSPTMPILSAAMPFPKHPLPPSSLPERSLKNNMTLALSLSNSSNNCNTPPLLTANSLIKTVSPSNYNSQPPLLTPSQNTLPVNTAAGGGSYLAGGGGVATSSLLQTAPQSIVSLDTIVASTMAQQTLVTQSLQQQIHINSNQQTSLAQPSNVIPSYIIPNTGQQHLAPPTLQQQHLIQQQIQATQTMQQQQHQMLHQQQPRLQQYPVSQPLLQQALNSQQVHRQQPPVPIAVATAVPSPTINTGTRSVQHVRPIEQSIAPLMVAKDQPIDASDWDIEETISKISSMDPTLALHVDAFRVHEIDGKALLLLTSDMLMKYLGLKLGPALKICNIIDKLKGKKHLPVGF